MPRFPQNRPLNTEIYSNLAAKISKIKIIWKFLNWPHFFTESVTLFKFLKGIFFVEIIYETSKVGLFWLHWLIPVNQAQLHSDSTWRMEWVAWHLFAWVCDPCQAPVRSCTRFNWPLDYQCEHVVSRLNCWQVDATFCMLSGHPD